MVCAARDHEAAGQKLLLIKASAGEGAVFQQVVQIDTLQADDEGRIFSGLFQTVQSFAPFRKGGLGIPEGPAFVIRLIIEVRQPLLQFGGGGHGNLPGFQGADGGGFGT